MKKSILNISLFAALALTPYSASHAQDVTIPNTFQSGATAMASEVNENFTAVKSALDDNYDRIAELEALVAALQSRIEELEESNVMALDDYVSVDDDARGPLVQFSGVNVQVVNGMGDTGTINGLGNLVVGYDEENVWGSYHCSDGGYDNQTDCEAAGETWADSFKTGSHYLVLGSQNSYSRYGGIVAGTHNYARGAYSTVTGGSGNNAAAETSSVTGGRLNTASGFSSIVSGGVTNEASGQDSIVSGGQQNIASGSYSSVGGGIYNHATNAFSSVSGGQSNTASGNYSSVSGGYNHEASGNNNWSAGSLFEGQ
jgi:hypothetical protein